MADYLTAHRHPAGQRKDQPAQRIDLIPVFFLQQRAGHRLQPVQLQPCIGYRGAITGLLKARRGRIIMLILNLADNFLNQILNRDQPVHTAKFIHHQRQMATAQPHFLEQVQQPDRGRDKQHRTQQFFQRRARLIQKMRQQILEMQHPAHRIHLAVIGRHAAVIGGAYLGGHHVKILGYINGDNISARDHHIFCRDVAQAEHIFQQRAFVIVKAGLILH